MPRSRPTPAPRPPHVHMFQLGARVQAVCVSGAAQLFYAASNTEASMPIDLRASLVQVVMFSAVWRWPATRRRPQADQFLLDDPCLCDAVRVDAKQAHAIV